MHGQIGQNLAVNFDTSFLHAIDETAVCQRFVVHAHSGVNTLDPQRAEIPFAILAVTCCVLVRFVHSLGDVRG